MFGPHLTLELYDCDNNSLADKDTMYKLLDTLPTKMGMTKITDPSILHYSGIHPEDEGLTGIVIIAESHISIHTFAKKGFAAVDVFSCNYFETKMVVEELIKAYNPERWDESLMQRGREFPRSMTKVGIILESDRHQVAQAL